MMAARWVIHTVQAGLDRGRRRRRRRPDGMLLPQQPLAAPRAGAHAFPAIGAGATAFPDRATRMAVREVDGHLRGPSSSPTVTLVCSDEEAYEECLDAVKDVGR
ncbi:MAG: hypothetical protein U0531_15415 [Dehalococcoidia bacterium]